MLLIGATTMATSAAAEMFPYTINEAPAANRPKYGTSPKITHSAKPNAYPGMAQDAEPSKIPNSSDPMLICSKAFCGI